ncbi:MAG: UDP-N-acetylmuramate dehydrogenase, partial [Bacteroidales bacterium]|nr:UDP-N-acetylmuramate dehydrogenase [Bacteroidales bacterium]
MKILENISLKPYNTFGLDVSASEYTEVTDVDSLVNFIRAGKLEGKKHIILGGGSNVLFTNDFDGLVIRNKIIGIEVKEMGNNKVLVTAGAGVVWDDLVSFCILNGLGGIENLVKIPGSVGAGPIQNIGAYGVELKDTFYSLNAVEITTGIIRSFTNGECDFGYRDSIFKREQKGMFFIVSVSLLLKSKGEPDISYGAISEELIKMGIKDKPTIGDVGEAISSIRRRKLPDHEVVGNAGSFFKNPVLEQKAFEKIRKE